MSLEVGVVIAVLALALAKYFWEWNKKLQISRQFPGPPRAWPFIGHFASLPLNPIDIFKALMGYHKTYGKNYAFWGIGLDWRIVVADVKDLEMILSSNKLTQKGQEYDNLRPWLGDGIFVTNNVEKWFKRRRIITPTFHFGILQQFLESFNLQSEILINKLRLHENCDEFDIEPYITRLTLDTINETAMGVCVNAQDGQHAEYVDAVNDAKMSIYHKIFSLPGQFPLLWALSPQGRKERHALKILHGFTDKVIQSKRAKLKIAENGIERETVEEDDIGQKKKTSFLELLLKSTIDGKPLTDRDIREEVDTFMLAGHDAVTTGMGFALYQLSRHPEIQERLYQEIANGIGTDSSVPVTYNAVQNLEYLKMVIKETVRLTPPIPIVTRRLIEDAVIGGVKVPAFTNLHLGIYALHHDETNFPNPEVFDPERFTLENCVNRHAFSYLPFSAGQRNCIGQNFATLQIKTVVTRLLQRYKLLPGDSTEPLKVQADLVLKPVGGWNVKIVSR